MPKRTKNEYFNQDKSKNAGTYQETLGIFIQKLDDLGKVIGFPGALVLPYHLEFVYKGFFLRIKSQASVL